ncbi:hypothetical protein ACIQGZ_17310 [Streptomyces sp. NPDC092296]|uniref:hypothetical protein n=1 Tax=Streptomyces sp. NPDC092296 TaxID=3366012 RepID=UPI0037F7F7B1
MTQTPLPWDDDHPEIALLTAAVAAGVRPSAIAKAVGARSLASGRRFSNGDTNRVTILLEDRLTRNEVLDELAHLAACLGHDPEAKRAAAERLTDEQIVRMIRDSRTWARRHGIDVRTEDEKNPGRRPATPRQVAHILQLLAHRARNGDGAGFMTGPTGRAGIEAMTVDEASTYIDSLEENY